MYEQDNSNVLSVSEKSVTTDHRLSLAPGRHNTLPVINTPPHKRAKNLNQNPQSYLNTENNEPASSIIVLKDASNEVAGSFIMHVSPTPSEEVTKKSLKIDKENIPTDSLPKEAHVEQEKNTYNQLLNEKPNKRQQQQREEEIKNKQQENSTTKSPQRQSTDSYRKSKNMTLRELFKDERALNRDLLEKLRKLSESRKSKEEEQQSRSKEENPMNTERQAPRNFNEFLQTDEDNQKTFLEKLRRLSEAKKRRDLVLQEQKSETPDRISKINLSSWQTEERAHKKKSSTENEINKNKSENSLNKEE